MSEKILENLHILDKEDIITDLIVYCVKSDEIFAKNFLIFLGIKGNFLDIYSRKKIKNIGIPDIIMHFESLNGDKQAVVIENKLNADEGKDQTQKYYNGKNMIELEINAKITKFIFLTLFEDQKSGCKIFQHKTYNNLRNEVLLKESNLNSVWKKLLEELSDNLKEFYEYEVKSNNDFIFEKLKCDINPLNQNYNYFKSIFIKICNDLGEEWKNPIFYKADLRGRLSYGMSITKNNWCSKVAIKNDKSDKYYWNEKTPNYNLHIEPQLNLSNSKSIENRFVIDVHYETNPYEKLKAVKDIGFEGYIKPRNEFIHCFKNQFEISKKQNKNLEVFRWKFKSVKYPESDKELLDLTKAKNQIAVLDVKFDNDITFEKFKSKFIVYVKEIENIIDKCIKLSIQNIKK